MKQRDGLSDKELVDEANDPNTFGREENETQAAESETP